MTHLFTLALGFTLMTMLAFIPSKSTNTTFGGDLHVEMTCHANDTSYYKEIFNTNNVTIDTISVDVGTLPMFVVKNEYGTRLGDVYGSYNLETLTKVVDRIREFNDNEAENQKRRSVDATDDHEILTLKKPQN